MAEEQQGDASGAGPPSGLLDGLRVGMTGLFDVGVKGRDSRATLRGQMIQAGAKMNGKDSIPPGHAKTWGGIMVEAADENRGSNKIKNLCVDHNAKILIVSASEMEAYLSLQEDRLASEIMGKWAAQASQRVVDSKASDGCSISPDPNDMDTPMSCGGGASMHNPVEEEAVSSSTSSSSPSSSKAPGIFRRNGTGISKPKGSNGSRPAGVANSVKGAKVIVRDHELGDMVREVVTEYRRDSDHDAHATGDSFLSSVIRNCAWPFAHKIKETSNWGRGKDFSKCVVKAGDLLNKQVRHELEMPAAWVYAPSRGAVEYAREKQRRVDGDLPSRKAEQYAREKQRRLDLGLDTAWKEMSKADRERAWQHHRLMIEQDPDGQYEISSLKEAGESARSMFDRKSQLLFQLSGGAPQNLHQMMASGMWIYPGIGMITPGQLLHLSMSRPESPRTVIPLTDEQTIPEIKRWRCTGKNPRLLNAAGERLSDEVFADCGGKAYCVYKSAHRRSSNSMELAITTLMLEESSGMERQQCLARGTTGIDNKLIPLCCVFFETMPKPDKYEEVQQDPKIFRDFAGPGRHWVVKAIATFGKHRVLVGGLVHKSAPSCTK